MISLFWSWKQDTGNKAGWVGIGFNTDDHDFLEGIFYKFSYPGKTMEYDPGNHYNGDALYYAYGLHTEISQDSFGMLMPGVGIPGESGSSLLKISNNEEYTAMGTLVLSSYYHCRITDWKYYMIKSVIEKDFAARQKDEPIKDLFTLYPNPASDIVHISNTGFKVIKNLFLFNLNGEFWAYPGTVFRRLLIYRLIRMEFTC